MFTADSVNDFDSSKSVNVFFVSGIFYLLTSILENVSITIKPIDYVKLTK